MKNRTLLLWVVLSTALWIVVGGLGTYLLFYRQATRTAEHQVEDIQRALSILDLSPRQGREIESILHDYQETVVKADRDFWQKVSAVERETDARIEAVLTEKQRRRYLAEILAKR